MEQLKHFEGGVTSEDWRRALAKVVPAVVVLRTTVPRTFDTEYAGSYSATGFIVDKNRGIILTNRHVVQPGPVVAEAMFLNREEIPVYPIYRDPVHDFGFFRYEPSAIQFPNYEEIPLAPEAACVGLEIRVVGNDSGEKVSILAGTIARLDRDAPKYSKNGYNDFNTFYLQAASGTKGGSSGSPVIDCQGRAVALNAGSNTDNASAFYLPLERVVRALKFLQSGRESTTHNWKTVNIPRGTLQATFRHKGFEETRRLGIRSKTEQLVRHASPPDETGMLVVKSVVPEGPADKHLEPGDVLVRLNGEVTTQFLKMENLLDESVNREVELQIERGGKPLTVHLTVQDLHSMTPDYFFEISGGVIHPLSYQQARNFHLPCGLAYVAKHGYMLYKAGVPGHAIIKKFAGEHISRVEDFISVLSGLTKGARVPLEYMTHEDRHQTKSVIVTIDCHEWCGPPQIYTRNDNSGLWNVKPAFSPDSPLLSFRLIHGVSLHSSDHKTMEDDTHQCVVLDQLDSLNSSGTVPDEPITETLTDKGEDSRDFGGVADATATSSMAERVIEPTLVMVEVHVPWFFGIDGVHSWHFTGTGVIIYQSPSMGLVAVDRNIVAVSACDVVFLHPMHNFALVSYDPSDLGRGASIVRAAELHPEPALRRGDSVHLVGLNWSTQVTSRKSVVTNTFAAPTIGLATIPRYRATNMEMIELDTDLGETCTGVLVDELGRVQAVWGSFSTAEDSPFLGGIPIYTISEILRKILPSVDSPRLLINGTKRLHVRVRLLEVELSPILLSKARNFGLGDAWIQVLMKKDPMRHQVLRVERCMAGSQAEHSLEQGDMILAINEEPVTCFRDIEDACQDIERCDDKNGNLTLTILRQGKEIDIIAGTDVRDGNGTTRLVSWCGCIVQGPHPAVRALGFLPKEGHGVYVARWACGSPSERYGFGDRRWIIHVNDKPTPDLDAFIAVTKELDHGEFVRVKTIDLSGKTRVSTLKQDLHYWPTWELRFDPETAIWRQTSIKEVRDIVTLAD